LRVVLREIFFLWRPFLRDPRDDMVLELAVEAECDAILTFRELAEKEGISINQLVATAVAEKMSALMAMEYLESRARRGSRDKFERALGKVKPRVPNAHDEL
jgi:hypothetical protein